MMYDEEFRAAVSEMVRRLGGRVEITREQLDRGKQAGVTWSIDVARNCWVAETSARRLDAVVADATGRSKDRPSLELLPAPERRDVIDVEAKEITNGALGYYPEESDA